FPALESGECLVFFPRPRDFNQRTLRDSARLRWAITGIPIDRHPAPRWLNTRWFARLLLVVRRPRRIAQPLTRLLRREIQQPIDRTRMVIDGGVPIADAGNTRRHRRQREILRLAAVDFVPRQWRGHPRVRLRPNRVGAGDRPVLGVLVVVEKDAVALFLPPLAGGERPRAAFDLASERERRAMFLVKRPLPVDANVDMHPARARRLRPADEPQIVQRCANDVRDLAQLRPWDAGHGIEIDPQLVRVIEIVSANRM